VQGLTIHSSRSRFAARLNSGVRSHTDITVNLQEANDFVRERGIVLESARGPAPSLAEAIAGEPINGNWWSHPRAKEIFRITRGIRASESVLVCRLVASKVTFIHQRMWPALVRIGHQLPPKQLARLYEQHTASGRHKLTKIPFPAWIPADVSASAKLLEEAAAWATLRSCVPGTFGAT